MGRELDVPLEGARSRVERFAEQARVEKIFQAQGKYKLVQAGQGKTKRTVEGELELRVPVVQKMAERAILGEVRRMFDAEAETLREMATLV